MAGDIHVGDVGTSFRLTLMESNTQALDVSEAETVTFVFASASGRVFDTVASMVTDGTDGKCIYTSVAGDLDAAGKKWKLQAVVSYSNGNVWHSDVVIFAVLSNLE